MYQLAPGVKFTVPVYPGPGTSSAHEVITSAEVQQYLSLSGFGGFKDIDYTKFDFQLKDIWRKKNWAILKVKPVIDWEQDGRWGGPPKWRSGGSSTGDGACTFRTPTACPTGIMCRELVTSG